MQLSKKEEEVFKALTGLSESVNDIEQELMDLEIKNEKDSLKWSMTVQKLKNTLSLEESVYAKVNPEDGEKIFNYLNCSTELKDELGDIVKQRFNNIKLRRVYIKLKKLRENKLISDTFLGILNHQSDELESWNKEDVINTILFLLDKYINNEEYLEYREFFLKIKYQLSFIYPFVEEDLLSHNLEIDSSLYWKSKALGEYYHFENLQAELCGLMINQIPTVIFDDIHITDSYSNQLFKQLLMRVFFLFCQDEIVKQHICNLFVNFMKDNEKENKGQENKRWFLVPQAIDYINSDRELVNIINFRR